MKFEELGIADRASQRLTSQRLIPTTIRIPDLAMKLSVKTGHSRVMIWPEVIAHAELTPAIVSRASSCVWNMACISYRDTHGACFVSAE
jgi:hypothetical protein